jgi:hypothetical protein
MTESDEFDWSNRKSVVVKRVDAIAVYRNEDGEIVIRQERATLEVDAVVTIPIQHAYSVLEAITRELKGPFPPSPPLPPLA